MTEQSKTERGRGKGYDDGRKERVLHVVVGHGLRTYFLNAVRSVRASAPQDDILVVDNASPDVELINDLSKMVAEDSRMRLLLRDSNDLTNGKVGGLYDAYREAFALAIEEEFDYLHLLQSDMQVLWWDDEVVSRAIQLFDAEDLCVNIFTCLLSSDRKFGDELEKSGSVQITKLRHFGLTDTGLFHLARWKDLGMSFDGDERKHAEKYKAQGFSVICHPWPTEAQVPWPAVVRWGSQRGREIVPNKPFLLQPLSPESVSDLKRKNWTWLEEICIPWGWTCLTPMWTTHLNSDYLAARRKDIASNGVKRGLPHWERRGLDAGRRLPFWRYQYRPSLLKLFVVVPSAEVISRLIRRIRRLFNVKRSKI